MKRRRTAIVINPKRRRITPNTQSAVIIPRRNFAPLATRGFRGIYGGYGQRKRTTKERKFIDTTITLQAISSSGAVALCNGVAQGTDYNQRIGRKFTMRSIYVRAATFTQGAAPLPDLARLMLVFDCQANGAALTITDVLTAVSTTAANNLNNRDRFKVIMDKVLANSPNGPENVFRKTFRKGFWEVINSGTTNAIGSIQSGSLYFIYLGDQPLGVNNVGLNCTIRVRFEDD